MFKWLRSLFNSTPALSVPHPKTQSAPPDSTLLVLREPSKQDDGATIEFVNPSGDKLMLECGHEDHPYFELSLFGEVIKPREARAKFCRTCFHEMLKPTERCSLCGSAIAVGDAVALYNRPKADRTWAAPYVVIDGNKRFMGCLGWDCCPSGGFFAGHLTKEGVRLKFQHGATVVEEVLKTGKSVSGTIG